MVQAGGSAAINGFLYQILHHLGWLADIRLTGRVAGQEIRGDALLVLEPADGGDARAEAAGLHVVEQYKARPDGTWSIRGIIDDILSDLRKAVREPPDDKGCYRFVTDGRPGRLEAFQSFLAHLKGAAGPEDLDREETWAFGTDLPTTHGGFFDHIVEKTRRPTERPRTDERATVFHLLARFEACFQVRAAERAQAVENLLRLYAPDLGDEKGARERLICILMEHLSQGEARLDREGLDALLRRAGLDPERLRKLARLGETLAATVARQLQRVRYRPETDVRGVPGWPTGKSVLVIAGGSGDGKTWQLGRLVTTLADARQLVVLVPSPSPKDTETILGRAAGTVWQDGLGGTNEKTAQALAQHYRVLAPQAVMPWLTIAVDDVQDVDLAHDLVQQDWAGWGMRLVLTTPASVARGLAFTHGDDIHEHRIGHFTVDEVDALLRRQDRSWTDLPADLKKLLRTPILAGLYAELPYRSIRTAPSSEYEIFERYWERMLARTPPGDEGILLAMAGRVLASEPYPLPRPAWPYVGLGDAPLARLEAAGWLQSVEGGDVAFAQDRLLNWVVAKVLAYRVARGEISTEDLGALLERCTDPFSRPFPRYLGYVPMDVFWLLAADGGKAVDLSRLVEHLEDGQRSASYEDLYTQLLPTLGARAVPILSARLNAVATAEQEDYRVGSIAKSSVAIARQEGVDLSAFVDELLAAPSRRRQRIALDVLAVAPDARRLDRLWDLHQERCAALDGCGSGWSHLDYEASFVALRAGVRADPGWLRKRILEADPGRERVWALAYLLHDLDHPLAPTLWEETKGALTVKVRPDKPRGLLHCIGRFADRSRIGFVLGCLGRSEDFAAEVALATLARLDPDRAIDRLAEVREEERAFWRGRWLPVLLRARPERTRQRLLEIAADNPHGHRMIADLFSGRADDLDGPTLQYLLRAFRAELRRDLEQASDGDPTWFSRPLQLLASITRPDLLEILAQKATKDGLEGMVARVAYGRVPRLGGWRDHVLEEARHFLSRVGGEGITALVNRELEAGHYWGRYGGLKWAMLRPNAATVTRLTAIASRPVPKGAGGKPEPEAMAEHCQATRALAAIGADKALVAAIWTSGAAFTASNLATLRDTGRAMDKALTARARRVLASNEPAGEADLVRALTVAWLSGDPDLIPAVRAVLVRSDPGSRAAGRACVALRQLGDRSAEFAGLAARLLPTEENRRQGIDALLVIGDEGLAPLVVDLRSKPVTAWQNEDEALVRIMHGHPSTRAFAVEAAVRLCREGRSSDPPYDIAAEAADPDLRETILHAAFDTDPFAPRATLRAIKGLAKHDLARAVEAAEHGLRSCPAIEGELCRLLVRLAPEAAAGILIGLAIVLERDSLRPVVGRALRRLPPEEVNHRLARCMADPRRDNRAAAAELAGWLPPGRLTEGLTDLMDRDTEEKVWRTAHNALDMQRREGVVRALALSFSSASWDRRWLLLLAILDRGDPFLLTDREDGAGLGHLLTDAPYAYAHHAMAVLRERIRKEK